jgi:hypothetical protein
MRVTKIAQKTGTRHIGFRLLRQAYTGKLANLDLHGVMARLLLPP